MRDTITHLLMSSVWDMILQWGSTIKGSIELPVATRHRRDMTENNVESYVKAKEQHFSDAVRHGQMHP